MPFVRPFSVAPARAPQEQPGWCAGRNASPAPDGVPSGRG
jgi:hypothetical protein